MITVVTVEMTRRHFVRHHKKGNDFSPLGYISEIGSKLSLFRYDRYFSVPGRRRGGKRKGVKARTWSRKYLTIPTYSFPERELIFNAVSPLSHPAPKADSPRPEIFLGANQFVPKYLYKDRSVR